MKYLLNAVFVSAATLFVLAPALELGGVLEALPLVVALTVGCLSVAERLLRTARELRRVEADARSGLEAR